MTVAAQRGAILAMLQAVPGIGIVHDEEPYARSQADFQTLYEFDTGTGIQIRGWFFRRVRTAEQPGGLGRVINVHSWTMRGFLSLDHEIGSGKTFDDLIEALRRAFRADPMLQGTAAPGPLDQLSGWQLTDSGPVVLSGALCHGAVLQMTTYDYLDDGE